MRWRDERVQEGDDVRCPSCHARHRLRRAAGTMAGLLFYDCGGELQLGAISGRPCVGVVPDAGRRSPVHLRG